MTCESEVPRFRAYCLASGTNRSSTVMVSFAFTDLPYTYHSITHTYRGATLAS